jgi:hypothetical protein
LVVEHARRVRDAGAPALGERELASRAEVYRDMAKQARTLTLRDEFNERAERYETVASLVKRRPAPPEPTE